jgi:ATP-dependent Lon protease
VREAATREVDRLERTSEQSPEHGWIRTWLDTLLEVPWGTRTDDNLDVVAARDVLDADHTGLEDVKDRIVEFLAVRKLRADRGLNDADAAEAAPSWRWWARRASARRRWASRWPAPWAASSCASPSAACGTRPRSAVTGARTSAPVPAASSGR